jgi:hypothetical protein
MKRRAFIAGLGGAVVWPVVAHAQQLETPTVGCLINGSPRGPRGAEGALRRYNQQKLTPKACTARPVWRV